MKHESPIPTKDEWLTPPELIKSLGVFDLDPCAPINRPWDTAKNHYTYLDNGLMKPWNGRVWCNPPYGKHTKHWLQKCAWHKNVIALVPARTETIMFFNWVYPFVHSIFFFKGRISFYHVDGSKSQSAGFPSVLLSYDKKNTGQIKSSGLKGKLFLNTHENPELLNSEEEETGNN